MEGNQEEMEVRAARIIQKRFRDFSSKRDLTESQKKFIKPWCKRWRCKSIFQVLLLYRAERLQTLVNFCLQAHIYNQNFRNGVMQTQSKVNLNDIKEINESDVQDVQPFMSKIPFVWERCPPKEDVGDCESLPDDNLRKKEEEIQKRKPYGGSGVGDKIISKNYEDKEIQTDLDSKTTKTTATPNNSVILNNIKNKHQQNNNINNNKESHNSADESKQMVEDVKSTETSINVLTSAIESIVKIIPPPRNKKLNKVQPPPVKPRANSKPNLESGQKFQFSLTELEEKFKNKNYNENGEDPPYNFRALLKKTNHTTIPRRASDQSLVEITPIYNLKENKKTIPRSQSEIVVAEIAPGILVYGQVADL